MTEKQKNFFIGELIISLVLTGLNIFLARNAPEIFIQIICKSNYDSKGKIEHGEKDYADE